ncbi:MAG: hypothetical protein ACMUIL_09925 [bacterium]
MSKKIFLKVSIISITLLLTLGLLISSNAMAQQWGWGTQSFGGWGGPQGYSGWGGPQGYGGRGFGNSGYGYGGGFFGFGSTASSTEKRWAGWNDDGWEEFIEELEEKYPDLEGIDWDDYENWDEDDWEALREALDEVRVSESLDKFIEDVTGKWAEYDADEWETFNENWNNFILAAGEDDDLDTEVTWTGFVALYGCFTAPGDDPDNIACWMEAYDDTDPDEIVPLWTDAQWTDFRGIYKDYLEYEWSAFNEALRERLEEYYDVNWEDWRNWTDGEWEDYLDKYSDFTSVRSSRSTGFGSPFGYGISSCCGYGYGQGGFPGGYGGGYGGYGYGQGGFPGGYGFGGYGYGQGGFPGGYGGGYGGYGYGQGGFPGGYGFGGSNGYWGYGGPWGGYGW